MKSVNAEDDQGAIVQMSVWPGSAKISADNDRLLLEREAAWTSVPVEKSEPVMERGHMLENNSTRRKRKLKEEMCA
ncbi:hypothetical protein BGW36DRAFT_369498 [Talaromyces proteolyticus]|uniref:Uncharacterized protein n=1 Tax=Talaromyces proteolyticus TaxID=1131652 RepID=A0AAD4L3I3_9EURO|nr:uncharacterized protein BGW36DRAFT_369498 [Talaromyces proteolyticus]KAH8703543.1 hypothetical protein BGW36DRAFT_369498 [Talaromyces proteolyticus]